MTMIFNQFSFWMQDIEVWRCCFVIMIIAMLVMFTQFVHPILRANMSTLDVVSFVWGAVCQQASLDLFYFIPNELCNSFHLSHAGHSFSCIIHFWSIHNHNHFPHYSRYIHVLFGKYCCVAAESQPYDSNDWWLTKITDENGTSRNWLQSISFYEG